LFKTFAQKYGKIHKNSSSISIKIRMELFLIGKRFYWKKILLEKDSIGKRFYWKKILLEKD